jgi:hypothetical protein
LWEIVLVKEVVVVLESVVEEDAVVEVVVRQGERSD